MLILCSCSQKRKLLQYFDRDTLKRKSVSVVLLRACKRSLQQHEDLKPKREIEPKNIILSWKSVDVNYFFTGKELRRNKLELNQLGNDVVGGRGPFIVKHVFTVRCVLYISVMGLDDYSEMACIRMAAWIKKKKSLGNCDQNTWIRIGWWKMSGIWKGCKEDEDHRWGRDRRECDEWKQGGEKKGGVKWIKVGWEKE